MTIADMTAFLMSIDEDERISTLVELHRSIGVEAFVIVTAGDIRQDLSQSADAEIRWESITPKMLQKAFAEASDQDWSEEFQEAKTLIMESLVSNALEDVASIEADLARFVGFPITVGTPVRVAHDAPESSALPAGHRLEVQKRFRVRLPEGVSLVLSGPAGAYEINETHGAFKHLLQTT